MNPKLEPSQGTVLVVDDAPDTLRMLCDALADEGYTVLVARDGQQALARLDVVTPDAILMDGVMPGLTGFETCQRIKNHAAWSAIPVIFMTGLSETADVVAGFEAGGVDYVVKPVRIEEVLARLATHVRNARAAREAIRVMQHGKATSAASASGPDRLSEAALTPRETEVLGWLAKGKTNRDIADILGMSHRTVNKHLEHIFEKLGVETRAAAAALATRSISV
ncbi:LuxR family transcriptional regulator [Aquabacterium sp. NJ1]|uniref:response regulator transcription factor n=1 Tax=Aquabacterium sp. NJ1 TaxID=1538295 RepID=UPI00052BDF26|nr:DNA-binding response regulator [Aquabacterium sp. NJ1]KGM39740.1 LuxR family transcriptional regulator [Aquabacterium sp. NJ1]